MEKVIERTREVSSEQLHLFRRVVNKRSLHKAVFKAYNSLYICVRGRIRSCVYICICVRSPANVYYLFTFQRQTPKSVGCKAGEARARVDAFAPSLFVQHRTASQIPPQVTSIHNLRSIFPIYIIYVRIYVDIIVTNPRSKNGRT